MRFAFRYLSVLCVLPFFSSSIVAHADTVCVGNSCSVTITGNSGAPTTNFSSPSAQATTGYTIQLSDNGTTLTAKLTTSDPLSQHFANFYFDTTYGSGSVFPLGFSVNGDNGTSSAFIGGNIYSIAGSGITQSFAIVGGVETLTYNIPNLFFLDGFGGIPKTAPGGLVRLNDCQCENYSFVGGTTNFPAYALGQVTITAPVVTPEPSSLALLGTGIVGAFGAIRRKYRAA